MKGKPLEESFSPNFLIISFIFNKILSFLSLSKFGFLSNWSDLPDLGGIASNHNGESGWDSGKFCQWIED